MSRGIQPLTGGVIRWEADKPFAEGFQRSQGSETDQPLPDNRMTADRSTAAVGRRERKQTLHKPVDHPGANRA